MSLSKPVAVILATVLLATSVGGVAMAAESAPAAPAVQSENETETPEPSDTETEQASNWSPPGPFDIEELRRGGTHDPEAPPSVRSLYNDQGRPFGDIGVEYTPISPFDSSTEWLEAGQKLQTDTIQFYSTAYGTATGEYELVIVYWLPETKQVDGTTVTYAANQSIQRVSFNVDEGYATADIKLNSQYERNWQTTMWLERDGERVEGARWRFQHKSNPLTAAPAFPINSEGDLWRWGMPNILIPALGSVLVAGFIGTHVLSKVIKGPGMGLGFWAAVFGVSATGLVAFATWQTAAVLARASVISGVFVGFVALIVYLGLNDAEVEKAGFFQRKLGEDAITPTGEERPGTRKVPNKVLDIIQRGDTIYAPQDGIRPMLARYWAKPAEVKREDLKTVDDGTPESFLQKLFDVDAESDYVVDHKPARLVFAPTVIKPDEEVDLKQPPESDSITALPTAIAVTIGNLTRRVNWQFVATSLGGGALVYAAVLSQIGVQSFSLIAAAIPTLIVGYEARDGKLNVEPSPYHDTDPRAIVREEGKQHRVFKTYNDIADRISQLEFESYEQTQQIIDKLHTEMREQLQESHGGTSPSDGTPDRDTGVSDD